MAVPKVVCGDCSTEISPRDVFCPSCGAKIERGGAAAGGAVLCDVCGHRNSGRGEFCESCGARLGRAKDAPRSAGNVEAKKSAKPPKAQAGTRGKYEPWQIVSVVAVLALVGYLLYGEITKDRPGSVTGGAVPQQAMPGGPGALFTPPAAAVDLAPFEAAVKAQPADPAALLRLANALHDNRMMPRAIETYQKYLAMRPKDPDARTDMGICYFQMAQVDTANMMDLLESAAREMLTASRGSPSHQPSAFNLGVVYLHMGKMEESNAWFKKAVEINKNSDLGTRAQAILSQHSGVSPQ
jgi:hypothetical protein